VFLVHAIEQRQLLNHGVNQHRFVPARLQRIDKESRRPNPLPIAANRSEQHGKY
jgi:hypothetical protein